MVEFKPRRGQHDASMRECLKTAVLKKDEQRMSEEPPTPYQRRGGSLLIPLMSSALVISTWSLSTLIHALRRTAYDAA